MRSKLLSAFLTLALCAALLPAASAAPTDVTDAKDELATVDITQICNGRESNTITHNLETDGEDVSITYSATLQMTEEMAYYLQARQSQLLNAKFNAHVGIETDEDGNALEFTATGDTLTATLSSPFLKPWDVDANDKRTYPQAFADYNEGDYSSRLLKVEDGIFHYEISVNKAWAQSRLDKNTVGNDDDYCYIDVPMELIVYYDGTTAYSYEDLFDANGKVLPEFEDKKPLFYDFTVNDWMRVTTVTCADLQVKDSVTDHITYNRSTWRKVTAHGTVDGEFTYEKAQAIRTFDDYNYANTGKTTNTLEFGNDFATDGEDIIEEWTSDEVWVYLIRYADDEDDPSPPFLNLDEHFAYVVGYPDGLVHPELTITRAEVATIFFRMLTDEVRNEFWTQTNPYNDVPLTAWYNNAISTLTNLGVINGRPDGGFHPTDNMTRGEFATLAVRFFLITEDMYAEVKEDAFTDIANHWANEYINMAYLLELVSGYPDGTFLPNNPINRAEAFTLVNNTLRRSPCKEGIAPVDDHAGFITWPDNMDTAKWYYAAVQEATNSHTFTYFADSALSGKERWTKMLPVRDWAAFEKVWSDANSASNPGEVVSGN